MDSNVKKFITEFFSKDIIKELVNKDDWDKVLMLFNDNEPHIDYNGPFIDLLVEAKVNFIPYIKEVPTYIFFKSTLLKEADLRECVRIGSRAFRRSNIEKIILYKNKLKDLGVGIISGVERNIDIMWDGTYVEWTNIRKNSNCWYNYVGEIYVHCTDGVFIENNRYI